MKRKDKEEKANWLQREGYINTVMLLITAMNDVENIRNVYIYARALWMQEHPEEFAEDIKEYKDSL